MTDYHSKYVLPLLAFICVVSPSFVSAVEFSKTPATSRPIPTSIKQPTSTGSHIQRTVPRPQVESGYCYVNDTVEQSNELVCKRKRGQFFTNKRDAQKAYDNASGFCCNAGSLSKATRTACVRNKGTFFLKQHDGNRACDATKGFCCTKTEVLAESKGSCDRKKGRFFVQKKKATQYCGQQKGYCCLDGTVSPMVQQMCLRKKGRYFIQQNLARQACQNERGFCCVDGKITTLSRRVCEQRKGSFSSNRLALSKSCVPNKKPVTSSSHQVARTKSTTQPSEKKRQQQASMKPQATLETPLSKTKQGAKTFAKPTETKNKVSGKAVVMPLGLAGSGKRPAGITTVPSMGEEGLPVSRLEVFDGDAEPIQIVYIKDRMVRVGSIVDTNGVWMGPGLTLAASAADFPCGQQGTLIEAELKIKKGNTYPDLAVQASKSGHVVFDTLTIQKHNRFLQTFCRNGERKNHQSVSFDIDMHKTCQMTDSTERERDDRITLAMSVICDQRPDADPTAYWANDPKFNFSVMSGNGQIRNKTDLNKTIDQVQSTVPPHTTVGAPSSVPAGLSTEAPSASLSLQVTKALAVDDLLMLGSSTTSIYNVNPVDVVTSNIDLELSCGMGVFSSGRVSIKKNGSYSELHQLESEGHQILRDIPLMSTNEFFTDNCAAGTFYQDVGRNIEFKIESTCTMPSGTKQYSETVKAPIRVTCDRRRAGSAEGRGGDFLHSCPEGYHILGDNARSQEKTSKTEGFNNPMTCIETR